MNSFASPFRRRLMLAYRTPLPNYLKLTALEDTTFTLTIPSGMTTTNLTCLRYSVDGMTWDTLENVNSTEVSITTPTIEAGKSVYLKGKGNQLGTSSSVYSHVSSTGKFDVSGNIASLLYEDTFESFYSAPRYSYIFGNFFRNSKVVHAGKLVLPVTKVYYTYNLYFGLFRNCTELIECAPITFINTLGCWQEAYYGCTKLEYPPVFPENLTFTAQSVFQSMFQNCTSLKKMPKLPYKAMTNNCYLYMFYGCTSLTDVDEGIHATSLATNCFSGMFSRCTSLTTAPELNVEQTISYNDAYKEMFVNTKVNYIKCMSISVINATRWLNGVPDISTSIFVKHINATWTTTGVSGVPTNWTVIYYDPAEDKYYTSQDKSQECDDHGNPI